MKKILFVTNDFGMGGAEKLLIDIVKSLRSADFDIDVLTFYRRGALQEKMQKVCNVYTLFDFKTLFLLYRKIRPYRRYLINRFITAHGYDFVVGFLEGMPTSLLSDIRVDVCKIAWVHNDFEKIDIGMDKSEFKKIYQVVDKIVCVSRDAEKAFFKCFSGLSVGSRVIYNLIDEANISSLSVTEEVPGINVITFLTVGMLRKQKCHDRLVRIATRLKESGYDFQIQIIGDGPLRTYLEELVKQLQVGDKVTFFGMKANPYPYIKECDCFVLASGFEGYGIVIKEALFLKKLILTTDVVGPREILEDGKYGLIVDNNEDALFEKMKEILDGNVSYNEIMASVASYRGDNNVIKQQLCELFS